VANVGKGGEGDSKHESLDYPCLGFDIFFAFKKCKLEPEPDQNPD